MLKIKNKPRLTTLDITGAQGNAFCILGCAQQLCKQLNFTDFDEIQKEMKAKDYHHLLAVFELYFGNYAILEMPLKDKEIVEDRLNSLLKNKIMATKAREILRK